MGKCVLVFDKSNPASVSLTEKSHRGECDINKIVARAEKSRLFPMPTTAPVFADISGVDFEQALIVVTNAEAAFKKLPLEVRRRFENNIPALLDFISDEKNYDEAVRLGLVPKKEKEQPASSVPAGAAAAAAA